MRLSDCIQRITVDSAAIKEVIYDFSQYRLQVLWQNGKVGSYLDVPKAVFLKLCISDSKGRFINQIIKPQFIYRRGE